MKVEQEAFLRAFPQRRSRSTIVVDDAHALRAEETRRVTTEQVERTVREGRVRRGKCRAFADKPYDKVCLYRYFGKDRRTIEVVLLYDREFDLVEVKTVWPHFGRKEDVK